MGLSFNELSPNFKLQIGFESWKFGFIYIFISLETSNLKNGQSNEFDLYGTL